jgi:hypothetical protein
MIIYSFDSGTRKLGFCCVETNNNWKPEISTLMGELTEFYNNKKMSKEENIVEIHKILTKTTTLLDSLFKIVYMNVFDLMPNEEITSKNHNKIVQSLKYLLTCLSYQLPKPDIVLIEHQMKKNSKTNRITDYVEMFYTPIGSDAYITYTLPNYPIIDINTCIDTPTVHIVGCSIKNSRNIDHVNGTYAKFIMKYNSSYTANKEHCNYNFKYYLSLRGVKLDTKESTRDIADAFMQAYAWYMNSILV